MTPSTTKRAGRDASSPCSRSASAAPSVVRSASTYVGPDQVPAGPCPAESLRDLTRRTARRRGGTATLACHSRLRSPRPVRCRRPAPGHLSVEPQDTCREARQSHRPRPHAVRPVVHDPEDRPHGRRKHPSSEGIGEHAHVRQHGALSSYALRRSRSLRALHHESIAPCDEPGRMIARSLPPRLTLPAPRVQRGVTVGSRSQLGRPASSRARMWSFVKRRRWSWRSVPRRVTNARGNESGAATAPRSACR